MYIQPLLELMFFICTLFCRYIYLMQTDMGGAIWILVLTELLLTFVGVDLDSSIGARSF
jgi:hypothetical protein